MVGTLLQEWAEYMKSPEYVKEKTRAAKLDPTDAKAVLQKEHEQRVKHKVHSLRYQIRQMKALVDKKWYEEMTSQEQQQYLKYSSGQMHRELEVLTREHGYGKLPSEKRIMLPTRFPDTASFNCNFVCNGASIVLVRNGDCSSIQRR